MKKLVIIIVLSSMLMTCTEEQQSNPPKLVSIQPANATVGERITLSGSLLNAVSEVIFYSSDESISSTPISKTESSIDVIVPSMSPGPKIVYVKNEDGDSNSLSFEILTSEVSISSISPLQGKKGETITISGKNLELVKTVKFGDGKYTAIEASLTNGVLKVMVPEGAISGKICLYTDNSILCSSQTFTVQSPPTITSVSRDMGVKNSLIEINGANLDDITVYFDGISVKPTFNSSSNVKVLCPEFNSVQQIKLVLKNKEGEASTNFTVAPAAQISTAIPNGFIPGSALTLKGSNYYEVQFVTLPGGKTINKNEFLRSQSNEVTFKLPNNINKGTISIVSQYGVGEEFALDVINGGAGLNSDNIITGVNQMTSIGFLNNGCGSEKYQHYYIRGRKVGFFHNFSKYVNTQECFNLKYDDILPTTEIIGGLKFLVLSSEKGYNNAYKDPEYEYVLKINYSSDYYSNMTYNGPTKDYGEASQTTEEISLVILEERSKSNGDTRIYYGNLFSRINSEHQLLIALIASDNQSSLVICQPNYEMSCNTTICQSCSN
jgi:hypothetical protein